MAVCRGIRACCSAEPRIKWTNDILLNGKKLCGILTELELEAESAALSHVVVGLGVNVSQTAADFGPELAGIATSLALEGFPVRGRSWRGRFWPRWTTCMPPSPPQRRTICPTTGPGAPPRAGRYCCSGGTPGVPAFAEAVGDDFGLVVRYPDGLRETVTSGEVSVRGLMGQYV